MRSGSFPNLASPATLVPAVAGGWCMMEVLRSAYDGLMLVEGLEGEMWIGAVARWVLEEVYSEEAAGWEGGSLEK